MKQHMVVVPGLIGQTQDDCCSAWTCSQRCCLCDEEGVLGAVAGSVGFRGTCFSLASHYMPHAVHMLVNRLIPCRAGSSFSTGPCNIKYPWLAKPSPSWRLTP